MSDWALVPLGVLIGLILLGGTTWWAILAERRLGRSWFPPTSDQRDNERAQSSLDGWPSHHSGSGDHAGMSHGHDG